MAGRDDAETTLAELKAVMDEFVARRDWQSFHDPKNLSMSLAIEAGELMEHFQWFRSEQLEAIRGDEVKMAEVAEELSDVLAYLLSFASTMGIDLSTSFRAKMEKNAEKYPIGSTDFKP